MITQSQLTEIEAARKKNMNKNTERQLRVLVLHAQGSTRVAISLTTKYNVTSISRIVSQYMKKGLSFFIENNYKGNNRNLSYEAALGRPLKSKGHIYRVL
jgi:transposase